MNLNEDDIRRALEEYGRKHKLRDYQIAELCGMSAPSVFNSYKKGKTQHLRADYLLNFILNTGISFDEFVNQNINPDAKAGNSRKTLSEPNVDIFSCPDCRPRVKKLKELEEEVQSLKDELLEFYRGQNKKDEGKCG